MNRFFVYHPVFAWVIALFIALFGVISLRLLPIENYPSVAPPALNLAVTYNGADAEVMDRSVTAVIEKELNGRRQLPVYGVDQPLQRHRADYRHLQARHQPGRGAHQIQDRLSRAEPRLPQEVRALGIQVTEGSAGFLEVITLSSKSGQTSPVAMGNFAENNIRNELRRIEGVGDVQLFGSPYAMRIWLDPQKLAGTTCRPPKRWPPCRSRTARPPVVRSARSR